MSSTAAATSTNGAHVNAPLNPASSNSSAGRAQLKMSTSARGPDGARKQAGSPVDAAQKAWQGTNPITQRSTNQNTNGVVNASRPSQPASALSGETITPMRHLNDRMMYLLANLSGLPGNITLKNGETYTGVLSGTNLDPTEMRYVFKMVKKVQAANDTPHVNGNSEPSDDYIGSGDDHVMIFDMGDVADFHVNGVVLDKTHSKGQNGASSFRTDTDISGNTAFRERTLQKWEPSSDASANLSLESSGQSSGWDQFATNERLFGVRSDYDENLYTTTIDRSHPQYAERAALAEKKAREIEGSSALNAHVREERSQNVAGGDKDVDEEDLYSGVYRPLTSGAPNKYTPPGRRPPSGQPTVSGAPVDPAIISSQLARPESSAAKSTQRTASPATEKPITAEPPKTEEPKVAEIPTAPKAEPSSGATSKAETKAAPTTKPPFDQAQKPSTTLKSTVGGTQRRPQNATANVEHEVLDSFKQFSAAEKLRMSERQRTIQRESKAVKLNDLKKFSQNFKLNTPVPSDLVPILAKDEAKQAQIVEKALKTVQEIKATPPKPAAASVDPKSVPRPANAKADAPQPSSNASVDRQQNQRSRPGQAPFGSATMRERTGHQQNMNQMAPRNHGLLSTRLQLNQQQHKQQGNVPYNGIPQPIPVQDMRIPPPTGPSASSSGVPTPTSSSATPKFNVRATEFRPTANAFQPGGQPSNHSSPRPDSASRQEPPRKVQLTSFFVGKHPTVQPMDLAESFNPILRLRKESAEDPQKARQYATNGGIQPTYHTPPTWDFPTANTDKGYKDMFERPATQPLSTPHMIGNGPVPHQHQLPAQFQGPQGVPQGQTPHHTPRHPPVQPHHAPGPHQFEAQHMQFSHSTSSVHPSPRPMPGYMYGSQPQPMPGYPQQVPMQPYGMSPNVQHVALRAGHGGPQFVTPPGPGMGAQMMTNQPSNGPYMGMPTNPQMQMYPGAPPSGFNQYPGQMPTGPGANGYPNSPRVGAPMMTHQGSQQGHTGQQMMFMQHGAQGPPMFTQVPPGSSTS
ncbi:poly(A)-binding protein binding protein [Paraconiothyrium brasiliense]|uniref:Poly(A)-binding protein binding protein n=1 Tax=Paraconiothyrium brasiliense TaxID=300254 RepID=A0ABR3S755_9PLEO